MPRSKDEPSYTFYASEENTEAVLSIAAHYCEANGSSKTYVKELHNKSRQSSEWRTKENERKERERRLQKNGSIPAVAETPPESTVTVAVEAPPPVTASSVKAEPKPKEAKPVKAKQEPVAKPEKQKDIKQSKEQIDEYGKQFYDPFPDDKDDYDGMNEGYDEEEAYQEHLDDDDYSPLDGVTNPDNYSQYDF